MSGCLLPSWAQIGGGGNMSPNPAKLMKAYEQVAAGMVGQSRY